MNSQITSNHIAPNVDAELASSSVNTPKFSLAGTYVAKCVKVYDGDTAHFNFSPWPGMHCRRFCCRFAGYNSAEIRSTIATERIAAIACREALAGKILGKIVTLMVGDFDKYGRLLVTVYLDGVNVNQWMIENGHGFVYSGRGEKKWE